MSIDFETTVNLFGITLTVNAWKLVGWLGAGAFGSRFIIQWIASERAKKSIIPFGFWEVSAIGSALLISYFIHKGDSVGVATNMLPFPIYLRNLYFRYARKSPKHLDNVERPVEPVK